MRSQSKIRDNLLSRNSIDKLLFENSKDKNLGNNTSNIKNISVNEKKIMNSGININNQVSSPKGSINKYNVSNKTNAANAATKLNNNFMLQSANLNVNEYKNIRRNIKNTSAAIKSISNVPGNTSNHSNNNLSNTPNKQPNFIHKATPSNLVLGESLTNVSNVLNNASSNNVFYKAAETARKLHDKILLEKPSSTNTPNNASKQIMKIKNFYEVVKNGTLPSNSNSARTSYKKPELVLNQYKIKISVGK